MAGGSHPQAMMGEGRCEGASWRGLGCMGRDRRDVEVTLKILQVKS